MRRRAHGSGLLLFAGLLLVAETLVVLLAAIGWLYWLRATVAGWPGPHLKNALPLDALAVHDSEPLLLYLVVFAIAGAFVAGSMRRARVDGVAGTVGIAVAVWVIMFIFDAISLFTVRQSAFVTALHVALTFEPGYLAAFGVFAGAVAGHLVTTQLQGRRGSHRRAIG